MHNFNTLKHGGGQRLTLLRRIAQKAVRHDTQSDCRRAEEVQDNISSECNRQQQGSRCGLSGRIRFCQSDVGGKHNHRKHHRKQNCNQSRNSICSQSTCRLPLLRHACGGRNHLLTEVAA